LRAHKKFFSGYSHLQHISISGNLTESQFPLEMCGVLYLAFFL